MKTAAAAAKLPSETVAYTLRHSAITDLVLANLDIMLGDCSPPVEEQSAFVDARAAVEVCQRLQGSSSVDVRKLEVSAPDLDHR